MGGAVHSRDPGSNKEGKDQHPRLYPYLHLSLTLKHTCILGDQGWREAQREPGKSCKSTIKKKIFGCVTQTMKIASTKRNIGLFLTYDNFPPLKLSALPIVVCTRLNQ